NASKPLPSSCKTKDQTGKNGAVKEQSKSNQKPAPASVSSSSSSDSSESEDDVRVVKTVLGSSTRSPLMRPNTAPAVSQIILDDDDDDEDVTFVKAGKKTQEKQPQVRTLAISGVSIRSAGVRASPAEIATQSAPPVPAKSRRLAISGVVVPIDKTPPSSFGKT
ncbi:hypothetical protein COOONC_08330, partial [Cooperia oncophora]